VYKSPQLSLKKLIMRSTFSSPGSSDEPMNCAWSSGDLVGGVGTKPTKISCVSEWRQMPDNAKGFVLSSEAIRADVKDDDDSWKDLDPYKVSFHSADGSLYRD
jgi:hypothetical protein